MDIITKNKLLSLLVVIMIFLNISLIGAFWYFNRFHITEEPHREKPHELNLVDFFIKELSFDKIQSDSLLVLLKNFNSRENQMKEEIRKLHNNINNEVLDNKTSDDIKDKFDRLGQRKAELDKVSYDFFLNLRNLCKADQRQKFDDLLKEIIKIINKPKQKNQP